MENEDQKIYRESGILFLFRIVRDLILSIIVIGIFWLIRDILKYMTSMVIIGKNTVTSKVGVLSTRSQEVLYKNINMVSVNQGLIGKLLNYGDLEINTGGDHPEIVFKNIARPNQAKEDINGFLRH